jgi:hypothetical protein
MPIRQYIPASATFGPFELKAMSTALEEACRLLQVREDARLKETLAIRIIELAKRGELDPAKLRDQVVSEANGLQSIRDAVKRGEYS